MEKVLIELGFTPIPAFIIVFLSGIIIVMFKEKAISYKKAHDEMLNELKQQREVMEQLKQTDINLKVSIKKLLASQMNETIEKLKEKIEKQNIYPTQEEINSLYSMWHDIENKYDDGYPNIKKKLDILNETTMRIRTL